MKYLTDIIKAILEPGTLILLILTGMFIAGYLNWNQIMSVVLGLR